MNIYKIADTLNRLAVERNFEIAKLQKIRKASFKNIFSGHSIFGGYAFNTGGRAELQFNIGKDWMDNKHVLRYGIAFTFQKGINLKHPIETMTPRVNLFNEYIVKHLNEFSDIKMWYHWDDKNRKRIFSAPERVNSIPDDWIGIGNFIVVGKYFQKPIADITESDLLSVLRIFDRLLPIYKFVEAGDKKETQEKIARICWNTNSWQRPSGPDGKSKDKKSHEYNYGYGHEEWLLDLDKVIDGYHYGFLEPVHKHRDAYVGKKNNITLYTVNSRNRTWYWVAEIKNVFIIDHKTSKQILTAYRSKGWLKDMRRNLQEVKADVNSFRRWENETLFNVRFRPEDVKWFGSGMVQFSKKTNVPLKRYTLQDKPSVSVAAEINDERLAFSGKTTKTQNPSVRHVQEKMVEYSDLHNQIQDGLGQWLKRKKMKIDYETRTSLGTKIDIVQVFKTNGARIFYEVKAYPDARTSIRVALGQLLEYAYYPNVKRAASIKVVSHAPVTQQVREYIKHLRKKFLIPINYIQFDLKKMDIIEEI